MRRVIVYRLVVALALLVLIMSITTGVTLAINDTTPTTFRVAIDQQGHMRFLSPELKGSFNTEPRPDEFVIELPSGQSVFSLQEILSALQNKVSSLESRLLALEITCDESLTVHLPMDEGIGQTTRDLSGYNNDGAIHDATWVEGVHGNALSFDGDNDYISCGNNESLNVLNEVTIEVWIKRDSLNNPLFQPVVSKRRVLQIGSVAGSNVLGFWLQAGGSQRYKDIGTITDTDWHHVVVGYSYTQQKCFSSLDGAYSEISVNWGTIHASTSSLILGKGWGAQFNNYFTGTIDEFRFYDRALSQEEISEHYNEL